MPKLRDAGGMKSGKYTGKILDSWNSGKFKVLDYCGDKCYNVLFFDTNNTEKFYCSAIKHGRISDSCKPVYLGKGYVGNGEYCAKINGVATKEYTTWANMMTRGYCDIYKSKQPTYKDCTVCPEWHNFQNFARWYKEQPNHGECGYELDKDLIKPKNLVYSPENCCILPKAINSEINLAGGKGLIKRSNGKYMVRGRMLVEGLYKEKSLGTYNTYEESLEVYLEYKKNKVLTLLKIFEEVLSERIKNALLSYNPREYL